MKKYQKFGNKKIFIDLVLKKANDVQKSKAECSGNTGKPSDDKKGVVQHANGVDLSGRKS